MAEVWTSYAGSVSSELLDVVEEALYKSGSSVKLLRYMRKAEVRSEDLAGDIDEHIWFGSDDNAPAIVSQQPKEKANQYYLRPGDSIDNLIECIAASPRTVVFLSDAYFLSPYCLSEMACLLYRSHAIEPLVVDQCEFKLHDVLSKESKIPCLLPGKSDPAEMTLVDALCDTLAVRYPVLAESGSNGALKQRRENIQAGISRLIQSLAASAYVDEVTSAIQTLSEKSGFAGSVYEATNVFKRWCIEDPVAQLVCQFCNLQERGAAIVCNITAEPRLDLCSGGSLSLPQALQQYQRENNPEPSSWRLFIETLAGFLALPIIDQQHIVELTAAPNGAIIVHTHDSLDNNKEERWLQAGLVRASLYGGGIRLEAALAVGELPRVADFVEIIPSPSTPDQAATSIKDLTRELWAIAYNCSADDFKGNAKHPTGLNHTERGLLRSALNQRRSRCGGGTYSLAVSVSGFKNCGGWSRLAHEFLIALNDRGEGKEPAKFALDILVSQSRPDAIDLLPFDTEDLAAKRFTLINETLRLA